MDAPLRAYYWHYYYAPELQYFIEKQFLVIMTSQLKWEARCWNVRKEIAETCRHPQN